jgi:hypothetical protein
VKFYLPQPALVPQQPLLSQHHESVSKQQRQKPSASNETDDDELKVAATATSEKLFDDIVSF